MSESSGRRVQGRVGTVISGKWQVDSRLGAGGMSTVYAVTHRKGGRAALKLLHAQLSRDEAFRQRFLREGYVANSIAHPGVCAVLDDGFTEDGCAYLVMELLEGETVEARRLRRDGRLPIEEAIDIAEQALAALAAAHDKGIVHRDVKPENMFVTTSGQVKLLDFGLARMRDSTMEATATGVAIGTPEFMPPEQALGKRDLVDARSDVWGLGASLFTMLSGRYVHDASSLHEQLVASATKRARSVADLAPDVPPALVHVIAKALELDRTDRWQSAGEMQRALRGARAFGGAVMDEDDASTSDPSSDRTVLDQRFRLPISWPMSSEPTTLESAARPASELALAAGPPTTAPPYTQPIRTERLSGASRGPEAPGPLAAPPFGGSTVQMRPLGTSSGVGPTPSHVGSAITPMQGQSPHAPPAHAHPGHAYAGHLHPGHVPPAHAAALHATSGGHPVLSVLTPGPHAPAPPPSRSSGRVVFFAIVVLLLILLFALGAYLYVRGDGRLPRSLISAMTTGCMSAPS